jgi:hypothetical protein
MTAAGRIRRLAKLKDPGVSAPTSRPSGWKTVGIFHFPHPEGDDEEAEPGNAGFC